MKNNIISLNERTFKTWNCLRHVSAIYTLKSEFQHISQNAIYW